ncbi:hypothetical protein A3A21_00665 [Candidatus Jorgensenbacteria bacterium RIFCSPLOWO2_01_FULL_45_25b]|uniref:Serine hydrolase family protein n=1 Tax=Candidatus Jorgensenbacteria bacterium RIFCSPLOWO2_01_FULL_45_25b TaxID=1798471 RepID=A0A1F6BUD3_9BACT|nr:MAG: hypothetical protein A3A21_00665 [Candidatus Jorgensenbacteria bacterium RIFCSPLOWO2_01_FULL_45_25b]
MKKRVFIIHGWESSPESNWFPWAKRELEKLGYEVTVPVMPTPMFPKKEEWVEYIKKLVRAPDKEMLLMGHSLGVIAILRYLESLENEERINKAILVAGFSESIKFPVVENFFQPPLNYEKIKTKASDFIIIHSDNDPYVPLIYAETMKEKLNGKLTVISGGGHLNYENGTFELPLILEKIK